MTRFYSPLWGRSAISHQVWHIRTTLLLLSLVAKSQNKYIEHRMAICHLTPSLTCSTTSLSLYSQICKTNACNMGTAPCFGRKTHLHSWVDFLLKGVICVLLHALLSTLPWQNQTCHPFLIRRSQMACWTPSQVQVASFPPHIYHVPFDHKLDRWSSPHCCELRVFFSIRNQLLKSSWLDDPKQPAGQLLKSKWQAFLHMFITCSLTTDSIAGVHLIAVNFHSCSKTTTAPQIIMIIVYTVDWCQFF